MLKIKDIANGLRNDGHEIERGVFGDRLVLKGPYTPTVLKLMRSRNLREININYARGFVGDNIEFLRDMPFVEGVSVLSFAIRDISPLESLSNLRAAYIGTRNEKTAIDFNKLSNLERCFVYWRPMAETLFDRDSLQHLDIYGYPGHDVAGIERLVNLTKLSLAAGTLGTLDRIALLPNLQQLGLYSLRRLESIKGIESIKKLSTLEIESCKKLTSIDPVGMAANLKVLRIDECDTIESLVPISTARQLEVVTFVGGTKICRRGYVLIIRTSEP